MSTWYVTYSDKDLMHYGVLGMKWGVRHDPIPSGKPAFGRSYNKSGSSGSIAKGGTGYSSASKSGTSSSVRKSGSSTGISKSGSNSITSPKKSNSGGSYRPSTIFKNGSSSNDRGSWAEFLAVNRPSKVGDNAPTSYTSAGSAAIVGGSTLKDMEEAEEILRRFVIDGKDPSEEELELFSEVMNAIARGNKSEYERMMRENPYVSKVLSRRAANRTSAPNRGGWNKSSGGSNTSSRQRQDPQRPIYSNYRVDPREMGIGNTHRGGGGTRF